MATKKKFETTKSRSQLMSKIKSRDTGPEVLLRKTLWSEGVRYRVTNRDVLGKPDLSIKKIKLAVFVDGEFWHGYNWETKRNMIKSNREYWIKKIEKNMDRDKEVTNTLRSEGWIVIRFWANEVISDLDNCVRLIKESIEKRTKF